MQNDYLITVFSRNKGKTRTFGLDRRLTYILLIVLVFLAISSVFCGLAYFQERGERRRLEGRTAWLEHLLSEKEEWAEMQVGEVSAEARAEIQVQRNEQRVTPRQEQTPAAAESIDSESQPRDEIKDGAKPVDPPATIDEVRVSPLGGGMEGFRLDFKLVNLSGEPISGNVAIIASLKPPHKPRFVSFPSMMLADGMPVKLRKSVGFEIRYYKYVTGRFSFPFSYSKSFRILIYSRDEALILDSTLSAEEVGVHGLLSATPTPSEDSFHLN
jgi:hypothetical protein